MKTIAWTGRESDYDMIDLTHTLRATIPFWPTHPKFEMQQVSSLDDGKESSYHSVCLSEHSGTHFDAPSHFIRGAKTIRDVPIQKFFGRMAKIDALGQAPDSQLSAEKILEFEKSHGMLEAGDAALFYFGWSQFWEHPTRAAEFLDGWPGLSVDAADLLVLRGVRLAGTDCLSIDHFTSKTFLAHHRLLGADILIGENFANLDCVPPWSFLAAMPLPIENGTGSPVRAVAFVGRS